MDTFELYLEIDSHTYVIWLTFHIKYLATQIALQWSVERYKKGHAHFNSFQINCDWRRVGLLAYNVFRMENSMKTKYLSRSCGVILIGELQMH